MTTKSITFTGGLGAQIISAAAYYYLQEIGEDVVAETSYFDMPIHVATVGQVGELSHWAWELSSYGLIRNSFRHADPGQNVCLIQDGRDKGRLGSLGLGCAGIRARFPLDEASQDVVYQLVRDEPYGCIHVRRGDYVNVASYLVSDEAFLRIAKRISRLVPHLLIISDTPLLGEFIERLRMLPTNVCTAIGGPPTLTHGIMRRSEILVCSNSQFSFTAAALRGEDRLTIMPSRHDSDRDSDYNCRLRDMAEFQCLTILD